MKKTEKISLALFLSVYASSPLAQTNALEEVVVTATKRAQSLQDVPMAVNAFNADTIETAGINDAGDLAILTPALNINVNTNPFAARMVIRGVGTAQTDPALEPSVGLFIDGIYLGRTGLGMSDLTDIERIEVLQGPQGTLYGKNTNAGAISVITKKPSFEKSEGYIEASVGNYSMNKLTASISGPLTQNLAYRLSGNINQRDGYYDNSAGVDFNDADDWNIQGKLQWEPTESLSILLSGSRVERDTTCCGADAVQDESVNNELVAQGLSPDSNDPYDYNVQSNADNRFAMESDLLSMTIDYDTGWGAIKSITAWNDYSYRVDQDPDRSELDILTLSNDKYSGDSFSQELRFTASPNDNVDYMLGVFYLEQNTKRGGDEPFVFIGDDIITIGSQQDLPFPLPFNFLVQPGDSLTVDMDQDAETIAFFGQGTWHIGDQWHITGGLRWSDEEKKSDLFSQTYSTAFSYQILGASFLDSVSTPIDATLERSSDNVDWMLRAALDIGDDSMVYASAGTGTKSGGFQTVNGAADDREFDDEDTTTYELGVKSTLLDARLRINAAAFYSEIENFQAQRQLETGIGTYVSNESKVETSGVDLQVEAAPMPNLVLSAGLLYMHKYEITDGPEKGADLPFTAEFSGTLAATLVFPLGDGGVYWRTDYSYMDDHVTNVASAAQLRDADYDNRNLVNSKLGWRNDSWNVSIWGKNLTDDKYAMQTAAPFLVSGMDAYFLAPPRTFGATVRYTF
ncbi:MAG: TonB-dependent receptor [Luminiphilus sp.]|jgi:iron complex outermembrane receptor protein|nr:TonB-dependent receptor [Luminiphilus sp.]